MAGPPCGRQAAQPHQHGPLSTAGVGGVGGQCVRGVLGSMCEVCVGVSE